MIRLILGYKDTKVSEKKRYDWQKKSHFSIFLIKTRPFSTVFYRFLASSLFNGRVYGSQQGILGVAVFIIGFTQTEHRVQKRRDWR